MLSYRRGHSMTYPRGVAKAAVVRSYITLTNQLVGYRTCRMTEMERQSMQACVAKHCLPGLPYFNTSSRMAALAPGVISWASPFGPTCTMGGASVTVFPAKGTADELVGGGKAGI